MKSYVNEKQFRLVGKGWEIKHQLGVMLQQAGPHVTVADYLADPNASHTSNLTANSARVIPFPTR